ncbi:hypothetical protein L596_014911 [Steinernema carpocapsae]|uniref:Translation elongation factor EF1B beta/delta subunit guanine nucleotide exchange domain-containing protein n=1 Tax=Steinernema carpocapsae TaxID=34508 RepID=A0A4U5NEA3_STECR|nr:hypothetical protein L596_014911 [Steinernema carpocapsae]
MSVKSLLSENRSQLAAINAIKAADQVFFGGKTHYTDLSNVASTSAQSEGKCKDNKKPAELKNAVCGAKDAAKEATDDDKKALADVKLLRKEVDDLKSSVEELRQLLEKLQTAEQNAKAAGIEVPAASAKKEAEAEDDDLDLFGSDDEEDDEEKKRITEERLKAYAEKKSKKPGPIAKSSVILDIKPWDDETDLEEMEKLVRSIEQDGLVWGGGKLIPLAYGIKKLQIICVIEDLKVSVDDLIEKITGDFDNHVQSVDIAAFNKI